MASLLASAAAAGAGGDMAGAAAAGPVGTPGINDLQRQPQVPLPHFEET